ncbi:1-deoxy-D-xylulose-5-phosphate synthase [Candidatus Woesearchaeota archaeon]|nr:1-deoxy-D-xylulose-5-phosphate synthase [Candidatus Woesearchaeota archaeon]
MKTNFLGMVKQPSDLRVLNKQQLGMLAREIRHEIINVVSKNGGHLAPSLGAVELAIALHYVFDSPKDKIVWDVGHQSYAHKLLTGRKGKFKTLRQHKGISGFPRIDESEHDAFGTGHSSTSISAALGIAKARDLKGEDYKAVAVIGDGALTGGEAFEGLNNAGHLKSNIIVILNDNDMSISRNVGGLSNYVRELIANPRYNETRKRFENILKGFPLGEQAAEKALGFEDTLRAVFSPGMLFKQLGFKYYGPIDGHDIGKLIQSLNNIKNIKGPVLLHVRTKKGKGYQYAEEQKTKFHGIGSFNVANGEKIKCAGAISYTEAFSRMLVRLAAKDDKLVAITAAMSTGTGLDKFAERFPNRFFDVGIAEQHAVTFAAGLAAQGFKPVVAVYSTFLQRAYDQVIHDVCLQNLPVVFAVDRAGLVGEDGATHHGAFDISFLRNIPNLTVMAPKDENELGRMLKTAAGLEGPAAIRYPRGCAEGRKIYENPKPVKSGKAKILRKGKDIAVICIGPLVTTALEAAGELDKIDCCVVNARFAKPLDKKRIIEQAGRCGKVLTIEENALMAGFGSAVLELLQDNHINVPVERMGIPDRFIEHGDVELLRKDAGLDKESIKRKIMEMVG